MIGSVVKSTETGDQADNQDKATVAYANDTITITLSDTLSDVDPDGDGELEAGKYIGVNVTVDGEVQKYWIDTENPTDIELEETETKNAKTIEVEVE